MADRRYWLWGYEAAQAAVIEFREHYYVGGSNILLFPKISAQCFLCGSYSHHFSSSVKGRRHYREVFHLTPCRYTTGAILLGTDKYISDWFMVTKLLLCDTYFLREIWEQNRNLILGHTTLPLYVESLSRSTAGTN